jgi:hypothetical protein
MSYDNLSSVPQNVLKFYQQLNGEERRGYILVSYAHSSTSCRFHIYLFHIRD